MVTRNDPARTGVRAGRLVGLLTAALAVLSLLETRSSFYEMAFILLSLFGLESGLSASALFWGNVALTAVTRYTVGYVVGSLVGVLYDWLDDPPLPVLIGVVFCIGTVDGLLAVIDTRSVVFGGAYVVAWFCYVPAFVWLFDPDAGDARSGPMRLGDR